MASLVLSILGRKSPDSAPPMICRMLFDELCVLAGGEIVCSRSDPDAPRVFGNVHRDRIAEVFNGRRFRSARRWLLKARPDTFCPVIEDGCDGRVSRASVVDREDGRVVRTLLLEPISFSNLHAADPVEEVRSDPSRRRARQAILPLPVMLDVVDQLPDLERLVFHSFGEPFLHRDAIPFLREVRRRRPDVVIQTCSNGLALDREKCDVIAGEVLADRVTVSIDGVREESYSRHHVGGSFWRALAALEDLVAARERHGTRGRLAIQWQYALFDWNDSDEEIAFARRLAAGVGVPLKFVVTRSEEASHRFKQRTAGTALPFAAEISAEALPGAPRSGLIRQGGAA